MIIRISVIAFFIDLSKYLRLILLMQHYDVYLSFVIVSRVSFGKKLACSVLSQP